MKGPTAFITGGAIAPFFLQAELVFIVKPHSEVVSLEILIGAG